MDIRSDNNSWNVHHESYRYYSVFDNPYKGAYEFSPYSVKICPEASAVKTKRFAMVAGAGYTIHPVLGFAWDAVAGSKHQMSVMQDLRGYYGSFAQGWTGADANEKFAIAGNVVIPGGFFRYTAGYDGIYAKDNVSSGLYNSPYVKLRFKASPKKSYGQSFDLSLGYRRSSDGFGAAALNESRFNTDLSLGFTVKDKFNILLDADAGFDSYSGVFSKKSLFLNVAPNLHYTFKILDLRAGVRFAYAGAGEKDFRFSPFGKINFNLGKTVTLFASYDSRANISDYHDLKQINHFLYATQESSSMIQASFTQMDIAAGLCTRLSRKCQLEVKAGYQSFKNAALENITGSFDCTDYKLMYTSLKVHSKTEKVEFNLDARYQKAKDIVSDQVCPPASFVGEAKLLFSAASRARFGVWAKSQTERAVMPSYVNLGVYSDFELSSKLTLWLRGGNLLSQEIPIAVLHSEKSINFTAGICLNL